MLILILPSAFLIGIIFGYPILRYAWLSLHTSSVVNNFILEPNSGANWVRLINDQRFLQDFLQTLRFSVISVTIELILAIIIALILDQNIKNRGALRTVSLLPWALPTTVMALGWRWIFNTPYGPLERLISYFGLSNIGFLSEPNLAWISTIVGDVWKTTPFVALIILAGLQTITDDLYEAFRLEGGNPKQSFIKITLPLLKPYILLSLVFRFAQAFGVFDLIQIMTGGGPAGSTESLGLYAYINAMRFLDFGYSGTIMFASFLALIVLSFTILITIKYLTNILKSSR